jgi:hypothetical protein
VFNFVYKSGDLGGEPVSGDLQVLDYSGKYIDFNLSCESGILSSSRSTFRFAKVVDAESGALGIMPRVIS